MEEEKKAQPEAEEEKDTILFCEGSEGETDTETIDGVEEEEDRGNDDDEDDDDVAEEEVD